MDERRDLVDREERIEVYTIGSASWERLALWRLKRAGIVPPSTKSNRRTPDRWHRRYQAEHTGDLAHLGASRGWTRAGACINHHRKCRKARAEHTFGPGETTAAES